MTREQPEQLIEKTFRNIVQKLQQLQLGLNTDLQTDLALQNKIILACEDVEVCRIRVVDS